MQALIKEILGLTSPFDSKVRLEFQRGQTQGQWSSIRFNPYCYEKSSSPEQGNRRALAMLELFGRAAQICQKHDPDGKALQMRSYYKDAKGDLKPNLHISVLPEAATTASAPVDYGARVEAAHKALMARNFDFSTMPGYLKTDTLMAVWMETKLAELENAAATKATEAPAIDDAEEPVGI